MRRGSRTGAVVAGVLALAAITTATAKADVTATIDAVLRDPALKNVQVGVRIVRINDGKPSTLVYERNPARPLTPASNLKLVTTAAALDTLGADFQFETKLMSQGTTPADTVLALVGDGDPSLGDAEALAKADWKSTTLFEKWADVLTERGVTSATKLVYDDSIFDSNFVHPDWPGDQIQKRYVAGVSGLNFNANCVDFYLKPGARGTKVEYVTDPPTPFAPVANTCVSGAKNAVWLTRAAGSRQIELRGQIDVANTEAVSVTVDDPPLFAATTLRDVLKQHNVAVAGEPTRDPTVRQHADAWQTLAVYRTPIGQIIARANKDSMNLYAEALCKRVGAAKSASAGSWTDGTAAVGAFLTSIGVPADQYHLDDGCGLSKKNVVSPALLTAVLEHELHAPHAQTYLASLSVAGVDGTLKDRFPGSSLRSRVVGKSGFVEGVSALAGFLKAKDGQTYCFSILFNGIPRKSNSLYKTLQEKVVQALD